MLILSRFQFDQNNNCFTLFYFWKKAGMDGAQILATIAVSRHSSEKISNLFQMDLAALGISILASSGS